MPTCNKRLPTPRQLKYNQVIFYKRPQNLFHLNKFFNNIYNWIIYESSFVKAILYRIIEYKTENLHHSNQILCSIFSTTVSNAGTPSIRDQAESFINLLSRKELIGHGPYPSDGVRIVNLKTKRQLQLTLSLDLGL